jgi:glycosyltransferase involved in cell wall biosynthesis
MEGRRVISFVIPAFNEERLLGRTVEAIHTSATALGEAYEVVVVDDASTDRTGGLALEHGARLIRVDRRQIAAARNAGARAARGEFLIFVDADTIVSPAAVREAVAAMAAGAAGGGAMVRFDEPVPVYARIFLALLVVAFRHARLAGGCFLFCTRRAFEATGGFDESLFGSEEVTMSRALKRQGRFVIVSDPVITSGRKVRAYRARELAKVMACLAVRGPRSVRDRSGMDLWYGKRRPDPVDTGLVEPLAPGRRSDGSSDPQ